MLELTVVGIYIHYDSAAMLAGWFAVLDNIRHALYRLEVNCIVKFLYFLKILCESFLKSKHYFKGSSRIKG